MGYFLKKIDQTPSVFSVNSNGIGSSFNGLIASSAVAAIIGDAGAARPRLRQRSLDVDCGVDFLA
jgi:hypothetical protein